MTDDARTSDMAAKTNLILGTITNYKFYVIEPFLKTLKQSGYTGDIVFLYSKIDQHTLARLRQAGVMLVPFTDSFPYLDASLAKHIRWPEGRRIRTLGLFTLRHLLAYCFLRECAEKYQYVMLSDIRDVIFQKDPFNFCIDAKLCCFGEKEGAKLGEDSINAQWIESAFDRATLEGISDRQIVCAGVTIGPTSAIIDYLEKMIDLILHAPGTGWELAVQGGIDQGVHNVLVHNYPPEKIALFENNSGPVFTLVLEDSVSMTKSGDVINKNGGVPNVVHQYDRHWQIARRHYGFRLQIKHHLARARALVSRSLRTYAPTVYGALRRVRMFSFHS
jgi:hypothetical protein